MVVNGHNWGEAMMNGAQLAFVANGSTEISGSTPTTFELSLADVSAVTAGVRSPRKPQGRNQNTARGDSSPRAAKPARTHTHTPTQADTR